MDEKIQSLITIAVTLLSVIAVAAIVFVLLIKIKTAAKRRKIESYGKESEARIDALLKKAFGDDAVFSGIYLPYTKNETKKYTEIDHLVITRGGICVVEVKSHNGYIRCPDEREWWQTYNDKKISFYNPLRQNKTHTKIVGDILRSQGHYNVPIYSVVVFTSRKVTFSQTYSNVIKTDKLIEYIRKNGRKNALSTSQTRKVRDVIKHKSTTDKGTVRRHRSAMRRFK